MASADPYEDLWWFARKHEVFFMLQYFDCQFKNEIMVQQNIWMHKIKDVDKIFLNHLLSLENFDILFHKLVANIEDSHEFFVILDVWH